MCIDSINIISLFNLYALKYALHAEMLLRKVWMNHFNISAHTLLIMISMLDMLS